MAQRGQKLTISVARGAEEGSVELSGPSLKLVCVKNDSEKLEGCGGSPLFSL